MVITDTQRAAIETFVQLVLGKQKKETNVVCGLGHTGSLRFR